MHIRELKLRMLCGIFVGVFLGLLSLPALAQESLDGKKQKDGAIAEDPPKGKGPPQGRGPMGRGMDKAFANDRDTFHFLLTNHNEVTRTVKMLENGVETVTESDKPEVAKKIQEHVPAMYERLKSGNGVRYWDPLFAEAFKHGKKMKMELTNTGKGVKVVETSEDAEVVKIIQAHADVVTKFVENGFKEAQKEHQLPVPDQK